MPENVQDLPKTLMGVGDTPITDLRQSPEKIDRVPSERLVVIWMLCFDGRGELTG